MANPLWYPSNDLIAQNTHWEGGALAVLGTKAFFPNVPHVALYAALAILSFAAIKEFVFDKLIEKQDFANNMKDFLFYGLGAGASLLALFLAGKF